MRVEGLGFRIPPLRQTVRGSAATVLLSRRQNADIAWVWGLGFRVESKRVKGLGLGRGF